MTFPDKKASLFSVKNFLCLLFLASTVFFYSCDWNPYESPAPSKHSLNKLTEFCDLVIDYSTNLSYNPSLASKRRNLIENQKAINIRSGKI